MGKEEEEEEEEEGGWLKAVLLSLRLERLSLLLGLGCGLWGRTAACGAPSLSGTSTLSSFLPSLLAPPPPPPPPTRVQHLVRKLEKQPTCL